MKNRLPLLFGQRGFSLLEVLISVGIIAGIGALASGLGATTKSSLKSEARRLMSSVRYSYFQAAQQSRYYRIAFNLDEQTYIIENSDTPFTIIRSDDEVEKQRREREEREKSGSDDEEEKETKPSGFAEADDDLLEPVKISSDIKIADIYVSHQEDKVDAGKAELYFFPRGQTELALIHLQAVEDEELVLTLIINPLSGAVEVRDEYVEHQDILDALKE